MGFEPTTFCMASASRRALRMSRNRGRERKDASHRLTRIAVDSWDLRGFRHSGAIECQTGAFQRLRSVIPPTAASRPKRYSVPGKPSPQLPNTVHDPPALLHTNQLQQIDNLVAEARHARDVAAEVFDLDLDLPVGGVLALAFALSGGVDHLLGRESLQGIGVIALNTA